TKRLEGRQVRLDLSSPARNQRKLLYHKVEFSMQDQFQTSKIHVVEALRGIASIGVALFHFSDQLSTFVPQLIARVGWLGVDMFFVISGFVIPYSIASCRYSITDFPRFICRRLVRLEPPYLLSIVLVIVMWHVSSFAPGFRGSDPAYSFQQV